MRNKFKGFYTPNAEELNSIWQDEGTIFVFDTNVLLNFYSYEEKTRNDFFGVLRKLSSRVWLPHQVVLEYQMRRLQIIDQERDTFDKILQCFSDIESKIKSKLIADLKIRNRLPVLADALDNLLNEILILTNGFKEDVFDKQRSLKPDVRSHDAIREEFDAIFDSKVGDPFTREELDEIYRDGTLRYKDKIPPGFKDVKKTGASEYIYSGVEYKREFGDFIIWKQLLNKAISEDLNNVVFITDDMKDDWWYQVNKKVIGPLESLQTEFYNITNKSNFKMYDTAMFLQDAKGFLNADIEESSFSEVSNIVELNREENDTLSLPQVDVALDTPEERSREVINAMMKIIYDDAEGNSALNHKLYKMNSHYYSYLHDFYKSMNSKDNIEDDKDADAKDDEDSKE